MEKFLFLDTNIFLHYQPFDQINWQEIVGAESVTIVIPPIIINELNKHKDSHPRANVRKRAGKVIKKLSDHLDSGIRTKLNDKKVFVTFEDREPSIDFSTYQLNFNIQDDQLIASILFYSNENPKQEVILVTSDLGLALVGKAGRQNICTQKMPDDLRFPDEPDQNEKKVKVLEQKIRELESRTPDLSLSSINKKQFMEFTLPQPVSPDKAEIEIKLNEIRKKNIRQQNNKSNSQENTQNPEEMASSLSYQFGLGSISQQEVERYNSEFQNYIITYKTYLYEKLNFSNQNKRTLKLEIALINNGMAPAEDIDIFLHFPDGFQLVDEFELPDEPKPPKPPQRPMTQIEKLTGSLLSSDFYHSMPNINPQHFIPSSPSNVSSPTIKKTNSYEVNIHVQKAKHQIPVELDPLFVVFDSFESANSFTVDYKILADNIPHEIIGKLNVVIKKDN